MDRKRKASACKAKKAHMAEIPMVEEGLRQRWKVMGNTESLHTEKLTQEIRVKSVEKLHEINYRGLKAKGFFKKQHCSFLTSPLLLAVQKPYTARWLHPRPEIQRLFPGQSLKTHRKTGKQQNPPHTHV